VVAVHVYGDGMVDVAFGPKEPLPEVRGQLVRYVREDLVVWPPPQGASPPPAEEQEAEEPDVPDYPQFVRLVLTPSVMVKVTGPKQAVACHIAFVERNQGRGTSPARPARRSAPRWPSRLPRRVVLSTRPSRP